MIFVSVMGTIAIAGLGGAFAGWFITVGQKAHAEGNTALFLLWGAWALIILYAIWR